MSCLGRMVASSALRLCAFFVLTGPSLCYARDGHEIDQALVRATQWLYSQQSPDHTWEREFAGHGDQTTGQTALVVYALLSAGQSRTDPRLDATIKYLEKTPTTGVYALGMRCQVWLMLPPTAEVRAAMTHDAGVLLQSLKQNGEASGFYDYNPSGEKTYSHSRAQYAVLGLWAAAQMGVPVPKQYWQIVEKAWISHQDSTGGWNYIYKRRQYPDTMGMTAVGVATLLITDSFLHQEQTSAAAISPAQAPIRSGMNWLGARMAHLGEDDSPRAYPFATLYAMERIGTFSGAGTIGGVNWYNKGSDVLIARQRVDGSFPPEFGSKVVSTSFAMLFLSRGAFPLMMGKLDDSAARKQAISDWNRYPRDLANLSAWTSAQMERRLGWRIMSIDSPESDWRDAPILLISGHQTLDYSNEQIDRLRQFIEEGGLVLGNADGGSVVFTKSFKALGNRLFPAYEFRPLPASHLIFTAQQFSRAKWKRPLSAMGLSNGVRELLIFVKDSDPARTWQLRQSQTRSEAFEFAADVFQYAISKTHLRRRGENDGPAVNPTLAPSKKLKLARLEYGGNWDPEPAGWRRLAAEMNNLDHTDLQVTPVKLEPGALKAYSAAHMTGTGEFELQPAQRDELRRFVLGGGTLVIDAAGGSTAFASSAEKELAKMFPDQAPQLSEPLPLDNPLYGSVDMSAMHWRAFARNRLGQNSAPRLRAIFLAHRPAVVYSREDLSAGLAGVNTDGITGCEPASAMSLMRAILRALD